ncbi:rcc01693 family protein [Aestuariivita sp.]|jgi:uncharacterized phage protein (TIGR02216 family)|uniref:rcc01693 family protein n=1 Tax=Aestuariivita sp. TaxID=1872407 RepID=UPI00216B994B|nr:rcc01693 family protein [Aestuariivita sp.]MCE8006595.1 phage tail assembly chaperone [Aestuariivita sp.]
MSGFDWPGLMRAGMQGLRLEPERFWALTPAELAMMLGHGGGRAPMTRAGLETLEAAFPDHRKETGDE